MADSPRSRRTSILYVRDTLSVCGPGKTILNTWRTLDRVRFQLTIVATAPASGQHNELLDAAERLGATTVAMPIGRGLDLMAVWRLVRLIRRHRIDILQTHDAQTRRIGVIAAVLTGVHHVSSVHGWIFNDRKERIARWIDRHVLRMADAVIAVSDRLQQELDSAGVERQRLTLLRNAVMLQDYSAPGQASALRAEFAIPADAPVVSIVGRLSPEKGHEDFLESARLVLESVPTTRFLIVGDGPLREALSRRINELHLADHVAMVGHRSNIADVYALTDVLAITSHTEGIPNVLLEAFAYGKPAVATAVGGVPEVLEDGKVGYLVAPQRPVDFAQRLVGLLSDPDRRMRMGRLARELMEDRFNFEERTRALERLYARVSPPAK
jgi:glycosyltransferase involved in cell wall biosynthesis